MRVYFSQYDRVFSMTKNDAVKTCIKAIKDGFHDLNQMPSSRMLKENVRHIDKNYIKVRGAYHDLNYCLDWEKEDWEELLSVLV